MSTYVKYGAGTGGGGGGANAITGLTGDGTATGPGSVPLTLATVNASPGSFGDASHSLSAVVNAKGLVTSLSTNSIQISEAQVTNLVSDLAGKQPTGNYLTALTGDVTASGPGSAAATLATVNGSPGSFGDASHSLSATVNAKGLITSLSTNSIQIAESQVTNLVSDLAGKQATGNYITALTGDATASGPGSVALTLATVNASPGSFGDASHSLSVTVNAKGLATSVSTNSIQIAESQVTNLVSDLAGKQATGNYITDLTGDVTASGPGSSAATLVATSNATLTSLDKSSGVAVHGTDTNDDAASGYVGEYIENLVDSLTTMTAGSGDFQDANSITLTAGDWDVTAILDFVAGTLGASFAETGISTTAGNDSTGLTPGINQAVFNFLGTTLPAGNEWALVIPAFRISLSATTTVYHKLAAGFTNAPSYRSRLSARRMR